ncbi:hypothetical protein PCANC_02454 [Puccinia coronata f. sp. avenae]|uniref:ubiquitinyl hydrolase 1 n=1 Tax=Puccinia coronata f. sp. avenae TaxID=200324 RepID=A0A2N5W516_9BASI|nr:hypothetical protein PCANC_02454 [Puccinia coronata f. sp. avenae]
MERPTRQEQADLYAASRATRMAIAQTWHLIHQQWFTAWAIACGVIMPGQEEPSAGESPPAAETPVELPPIDNAELLDENNQLRFGISIGIDCEIVPDHFWDLLVKWYGLKHPAHAIPRTVIAPSGPSSESVEFYPPSFIFHLVLNKDQLAQYDQAEVNIMNTLPQLAIQKNFSIAHSLQHLKNELTHHLLPSGLITRSFKLWSIHSPPTSADQLILTPHEFSALDTQLINPASGDSADLNEALLTEPVNRIAIEQQHPSGNWLIIEPTTNPVPPSTPPQDADSTGPVFGGQDWLDRMERMNQANSLDPKFSLSTPVQPDLNLISFGASQASLKPRGIRGLVGLSNLGNTCFMNSALQCMSNCPELKTYFLSRVYISELNRTNPLGMGGKVAETFGQLIERMWSSEYEVSAKKINGCSSSSNGLSSYTSSLSYQSISPREFKSIVGRFNSLFLGYGQQDSQELLTFLLDALHEDLNRVKVKPFDEIPDYDDENSADDPLQEAEKILNLAKTCWNLYRRRNDSVIVDLFQGQYKSTLICPDCNKVAIKFDEIMYLTLQLPINKKFKGTIYFVPLDLSKPRIKVVYQMNKDSTIRQLKQHIGQILSVDPNRMAAVEDWSGKPWKIWQDTDSLEGIMERDVINVFETPLPFAALKSGVYYTNGEEAADLLIPVVSYRVAERSSHLANSSSSSMHKPAHMGFGVFFVARISGKDRMSSRGVYDAIAREYSRYTTQADDLFEPCEQLEEEQDVEMKDPGADSDPPPAAPPQPERHAVPNLFKISVPRVPCPTVFPISSSMGNATIDLEERVKLSLSKAAAAEVPTVNVSQNGAVFETNENEDLYEDKTGKETTDTDQPPPSSSTPPTGPVVFEGDYFECEWTPSAMGHFFGLDKSLPNSKNWIEPPVIEDPELVASRVAEQTKKAGELTIEECFKDFSKPEKLGEEDKWYCPRCKNHVQATKQMQIWKVPDILVVHFKRFSSARTSYGRSSKVDNFVDFPIEGLDLSQEVEGIRVMRELKKRKRQLETLSASDPLPQHPPLPRPPQILIDALEPSSSASSEYQDQSLINPDGKQDSDAIQEDQNDELQQDPPQPADQKEREGGEGQDQNEGQEQGEEDEEEESLIYDLFAVDNHFGGLGGGHYTAFAKNEEDGKWHNYDDSHVTEVSSPEKVKSAAAYLLFYRRRTSRKLGLKTHGIVSSAMQSRDISVSPSVAASSEAAGSASGRAAGPGTGTARAWKGAGASSGGGSSSGSSTSARRVAPGGSDDDDDDELAASSVAAVGPDAPSPRSDVFEPPSLPASSPASSSSDDDQLVPNCHPSTPPAFPLPASHFDPDAISFPAPSPPPPPPPPPPYRPPSS